jgi:hypothetical protein
MDNRVFWSVLAALLVFSGIVSVVLALGAAAERKAALDAEQQAEQQVVDQANETLHVSQQQAYQRDVERRYHLRLGADQSCVGGVVIERHGSAFTQLGSIAQPIHCQGIYADQPLR